MASSPCTMKMAAVMTAAPSHSFHDGDSCSMCACIHMCIRKEKIRLQLRVIVTREGASRFKAAMGEKKIR